MLVLTRKRRESFVIHRGGEILAEIVVDTIKYDKVRLAVEAPPSVGIDRKEIYELKISTGSLDHHVDRTQN